MLTFRQLSLKIANIESELIKMSFPEQLRKARLERGYTQQQVADSMGITKSTYCGYETGKRQPDVAKIKQIASFLQTSPDILLETNQEATDSKQKNNLLVTDKDEIALLETYRSLSVAGQPYARGMLTGLLHSEKKALKHQREIYQMPSESELTKRIESLDEEDQETLLEILNTLLKEQE